MSTTFPTRAEQPDSYGGGLAGSIVLHLALFGGLIGAGYLTHRTLNNWGDKSTQTGAIEASMVSAVPLPSKVPPVKDQVLQPEDASIAPTPPPKEATAPPPKPNDVLIKAPTATTKIAPTPTAAPPKHAQPTPDTSKATTGESASALPESITQVKNGSSAATIQDKAFGTRFAYYRDAINRKVSQNWYTAEADPAASQGKHVVMLIDIDRDGNPSNIRVTQRSGVASLDTSAMRAIQRIDNGFGPLPGGSDHITVQLNFDYHQP